MFFFFFTISHGLPSFIIENLIVTLVLHISADNLIRSNDIKVNLLTSLALP